MLTLLCISIIQEMRHFIKADDDAPASTPLLQAEPANCITKSGECCKKISPFLMVCGAGLIFSTQAVLSKLMPIPPGQYVVTESALNIPLCLVICFYSGVDVSPLSIRENRTWFWARVVFGGVASGGKILVVRNMDIGDATAIIFSAPIWAGCLARIILKEKYTIINVFATTFGLIGIVLVTKPGVLFLEKDGGGESSVPWACATLGVSVITAVSYVCVRGAGQTIHPMKFALYTACVELVCGFVTNPIMGQSLVLPPCDWVRVALVLCGVGATLANVLIVRGLSLENSGPASLMRNWDIVYAYIFQIVFFKITPDWISLLGAGLIVCTALLQGIDKLFNISCGIEF